MGKNKQRKKKTSSPPKKKDSSSFFDSHRLQVKSRVRFPDCEGLTLEVPPEELFADVTSGMPMRLLSFKYGLPKDGGEAKDQIRQALSETIEDEKEIKQLLNKKKKVLSYQPKHPSRLASSYVQEERKLLLQDLRDPKILDFEIKRCCCLKATPSPKDIESSSAATGSFRKVVSNLSEGSRKEMTSFATSLQQCFEGLETLSPFYAAGGLPPEMATTLVAWFKGFLCGVFREIAPASKKRKKAATEKPRDSGTSLPSSGDDQTPPPPSNPNKKRRLNEDRPLSSTKSLFPTESKGKEKEEAPTEEAFNNDTERSFLEEQQLVDQPQQPEIQQQQQQPEHPQQQQAKQPQQPSNQLDLSDADSKPDPCFWPSEEEEEPSQETKVDERQDSPTLVDAAAAADRFVFSVLVSTDSNNDPAEPPNTQEEQTNSSTVVTTTRTTEDKNKDKAEDSVPASEEEIFFNPEQQQQQSDKEKKGEELSATASMAHHLSEDFDEGHESDATMRQDGLLAHNGGADEPPNDLIQEADLNPNTQQPNGTTSRPIEEETKEGRFNNKDQGCEEEEEEEEGQESDTTTLSRFNASTNMQPVVFKEMMTPFCILEGTEEEESRMNNLYQVSQEATENPSPSSQSITFEQESVALQPNTPPSTKTMPGQKQARAKKKRQDNLSIQMVGWTDPISTTRTRSRNASRVPLFDGIGTLPQPNAKEESSSRPGPKGKVRRNRKRQRDDSLTGCDSELCDIDLRLIINHETWSTLLTAEERNRLQLLLPQQDRTDEETLKRALDHNPFLHHTLEEYQGFQRDGLLETGVLRLFTASKKPVAEDGFDIDAYMSFHGGMPQLTEENRERLSLVYKDTSPGRKNKKLNRKM